MKLTARLAAVVLTAFSAVASADAPRGDYVEVRTASVFAGACHYNGERVTDGRSAVLAWSIRDGDYAGQDLAGVRVVAKLTSEQNLADEAGRRSEIVVDAPTAAASDAAVAWVKSQTAGQLGTVLAVRRGPVAFDRSTTETTVSAGDFAALVVRPMPDAACCSQPHLVWYKPLATVDGRRVGYTVSARSTAGASGDAWQRADENGAIYGAFGPTPAAVAAR